MSESTADIYIVASSLFTAICGFVFVGVYALLAPWRKSAIGRHVMTLSASIAFITLFAVLIKLAPNEYESGLKVVRSFGVAFVGLLLLKRTQLVVQAQKRRKQNGSTHDGG